MNDSTIEQAVKDVRGGDRDQFGVIIDACQQRIQLVVASVLPHGDMVEDVAQETLVTAYTRLSTYKQGTDFMAWICTIARNLALNERRKWFRKHHHRSKYHAQVEQTASAFIENNLLAAETTNILRECIGELAGHSRDVVERFYLQGTSQKDLAHVFGRSQASIAQVLFRARGALADCLGRKGVRPDA